METFSELGLFQSSSNVNNELITLQSPAVMAEVVKRLNLYMSYYQSGKFHKEVAYGLTLPVTVSMNDFPENESAEFTLEVKPDRTVILSNFMRNDETLNSDEVKGILLDTVSTPLGKIIVKPTLNINEEKTCLLQVFRNKLYDAINSYSENLSVTLSNEKASVIDLSFKDYSIQRAEDVLSMLISVYNETG